MAGEWLKLELSTPDKPELLKLSRITNLHKDAVLGKLIRVWAWFDRNSVDGHVDGVVAADIDELALHDGFSSALKQVKWMDFCDNAQWVKLTNFDRHNGETAKTRALKTKRQGKWRANKDGNVDSETSTQASTPTSTREEKRREDINTPPKKAVEELPIPDFIPVELWNEFMAIRKKVKAQNTPLAIKSLINSLMKFRDMGYDPVQIVTKSVTNSWKDVFQPKEPPQVKQDWKRGML